MPMAPLLQKPYTYMFIVDQQTAPKISFVVQGRVGDGGFIYMF